MMGTSRLPNYGEIRWVHRIELPDGRITPGKWPPRFKEFGLEDIDFLNRRVLDIGCLDGLYSFYAERRGASEVVSIDINEEQFGKQRYPGQNWSYGYLYAHEHLKSEAKYVFPSSVYDLAPSTFGQFDIILFLGVIYHLVHPVLALERINRVLKPGGLMVLETEVSNANTMFCHKPGDGNSLDAGRPQGQASKGFSSRFLSFLGLVLPFLRLSAGGRKHLIPTLKSTAKQIVPELYDSDETYKEDVSNFWIMDSVVLGRIIDFSGFRIDRVYHGAERMSCVCTKVKEFPDMYADRSRVTHLRNRTTNFQPIA